ncbi:hypothetical protein ACWGJ2_22370 [Streptomyces sp. NPDC054796]
MRLRVELVVEIADPAELTRAALARIEGDALMPDEEREHAREIVAADAGEAIAYLVDPVDLVNGLPGVELAHASWGSEGTHYDPDDPEGPDGFDFDDLDDVEDPAAENAVVNAGRG